MTEVEPVLDFATSGRTGRRNALPDILGSPAGVSPSELPMKLAELSINAGMDFANRQVGNVLKPITIIKVDGDNIILQTKSTYRNTEIIFQLDKPFNEHTADNRDCKTVVSLEGDKLIQVQKWDGKQTTLTREIKNEHLILTLTLNDVVSVRTYERELV
ncbi:fatty acid-binding protein, brain-like isoform X1 [Chiloscyllium plagiosum]|uniref:fatty acid-binding protein, brain-like isoform X1 n=1 Tax=Chiloscyllium plagiosum TaxID=36176 RepID=UPI001CB80598|nr:fatty acid-binding protein, brain-like isoform X1 [Chiloscyllium plagiosum]XP_043573539.1 fatty acid-binding protein, brain-like isoform X1 [Chiloscyllium plagiosum]XP_043573541.1 fatty acid-binding protein, brain-like isoform X1 [Chiloscyllium plagiosum]XP_043573542.1 fatty acid-binding protein, brain-like isoform X1 [Chiloscyllium plagiosum]XP_043573543.1 fatty acid-binding protein, brain-like isoform X1 [Chiloscyllium plagiosum]